MNLSSKIIKFDPVSVRVSIDFTNQSNVNLIGKREECATSSNGSSYWENSLSIQVCLKLVLSHFKNIHLYNIKPVDTHVVLFTPFCFICFSSSACDMHLFQVNSLTGLQELLKD